MISSGRSYLLECSPAAVLIYSRLLRIKNLATKSNQFSEGSGDYQRDAVVMLVLGALPATARV